MDDVTPSNISSDWFPLGISIIDFGDVVFEYTNTSIEYVLLVGHSEDIALHITILLMQLRSLDSPM